MQRSVLQWRSVCYGSQEHSYRAAGEWMCCCAVLLRPGRCSKGFIYFCRDMVLFLGSLQLVSPACLLEQLLAYCCAGAAHRKAVVQGPDSNWCRKHTFTCVGVKNEQQQVHAWC
jgi:hypothetical protein